MAEEPLVEGAIVHDHGSADEFGTHVYAASPYTFELSLLST